MVDVSGLLFGAFYILTALATMAYYRRRVLASFTDALTLGVLPLAAAGFLAWVLAKSVQTAAPAQNWSLAGIVITGLVLMLAARYGLKSRFFGIARESDQLPEVSR